MILCFFSKKKSPFEYASYAQSNKDFNFDRLFLSNHSPAVFALEIRILRLEVRSHRPHRARSDTYFAKLKRSYFWFAPPLYPRDRTSSNNSHHWAWRAGLVPGVAREDANRSNWTMHNMLVVSIDPSTVFFSTFDMDELGKIRQTFVWWPW